MIEQHPKRSRLGSALTTAGGIVGVIGVVAMAIGLKANVTGVTQPVVLIRGILSTGGLIAFGLAAVMIIAGSIIGRRRTAMRKTKPVETSARTGPDLLSTSSQLDAIRTSDASEKHPSEIQ